MKSIAKGLAALNLLALTVTAAMAWGTDTEWLDTASYVGLGMGGLGALIFMGSSTGVSGSTGMAASAADRPSRIMDALWMDRTAGISTGAIFVLSGLVWVAVTWLLTAFAG